MTGLRRPGHGRVKAKFAHPYLQATMLRIRALGFSVSLLCLVAAHFPDQGVAQELRPEAQNRPEIKMTIARANAGDAEAEYHVGEYYDDGAVYPRDEDKAFYWFSKSAEQGYHWAEFYLARFYQYGAHPAQKNREKAISLYRRAAQLEDVQIFNTLGDILYDNGHCHARECEEAASWFRKSPDYGDSSEQLGQMYEHGRGVRKSIHVAVTCYERAGRHGFYPAFKLVDLYLNENSGVYNPTMAAAWLEATTSPLMLQSDLDKARAKRYLRNLKRHMTIAQITAAHNASKGLLEEYGVHALPVPLPLPAPARSPS